MTARAAGTVVAFTLFVLPCEQGGPHSSDSDVNGGYSKVCDIFPNHSGDNGADASGGKQGSIDAIQQGTLGKNGGRGRTV